MGIRAQVIDRDPTVEGPEQGDLDLLQTQIQVILDDLTDAASVDMTKITVNEMKQMASNLSRVVMQAELKLRQT